MAQALVSTPPSSIPCLINTAPACLSPQVVLLDPVLYPAALKAFAREVCKNDLLNFGRMHWFFPDSRLALDLNTDKTLKVGWGWMVVSIGNCWRLNSSHKAPASAHTHPAACVPQEARFDRHHVRDLQWSRHQLEELAERRFVAAQMEQLRRGGAGGAGAGAGDAWDEDRQLHSFADLFQAIKVEDFSSYISKVFLVFVIGT